MKQAGGSPQRPAWQHYLRLVLINLVVLALLLLLLEIGLRLGGRQTLVQMAQTEASWENRIRDICDRIARNKVTENAAFYTDEQGLLKASADTQPNSAGQRRINADGFRGNPFEPVAQKTTVMIIGDSFVWGSSAKPITRSFPDLLGERGYHVYNAGIPGTDPNQYAAVAETYVPRVKPDVVIVCVYLGNDINQFPIRIIPGQKQHFITNIGQFRARDETGRPYKNLQTFIRTISCRKCGHCRSLLDFILYKTVIGRAVHDTLLVRPARQEENPQEWVIDCLQRIRRVSEAHGAEVLVCLIPFARENLMKKNSLASLLPLFSSLEVHYPRNLEKSDYCTPPDNHFNNAGHAKFAAFLDALLRRQGHAPRTEERP